jgi:hypothetical protein
MSKLKVLKKLGAIQNALKVAKGSKNSHGNYNYRSAEDILEALKPHAAKNNVTFLVTEELKEINGILYIESTATMYDLESDESVSSSNYKLKVCICHSVLVLQGVMLRSMLSETFVPLMILRILMQPTKVRVLNLLLLKHLLHLLHVKQ